MKTNSTNWNGQHAIAPADSPKLYTEQLVSFVDFLLESQRNDFYQGDTHQLVQPKGETEQKLGEIRWFKDDYGVFTLLWRSSSDSSGWMPLELDSFMLTTQVHVA